MQREPSDYYRILGVHSSATPEEIRRAYRILARRYHPDMNPGKATDAAFKQIAEAYSVLSDPIKRSSHDAERESAERRGSPFGDSLNARRAYRKPNADAQRRFHAARAAAEQRMTQARANAGRSERARSLLLFPSLLSTARTVAHTLKALLRISPESRTPRPQDGTTKLSILEVSVSMRDAIQGVRKTVEISEPEGQRKISITVPPGVRSGSIIRFRARGRAPEELVIIIRVASHPFLSMEQRGLVVNIPVTVAELLNGANITVPTLEDHAVIKIPPGSPNGHEIRLPGRGVCQREAGQPGDLFFRLQVRLPEANTAVGLAQKASDLDPYYDRPVRSSLPRSLVEA